MVVGAVGPWVELLGLSARGTDSGNDGWLVVAVAVVAGAIFRWQRRTPRAGAAAIAGGVLGAIITIYNRSNVAALPKAVRPQSMPGRLGPEPGDPRVE